MRPRNIARSGPRWKGKAVGLDRAGGEPGVPAPRNGRDARGSRAEQEEAINVARVVGGIVIPHMRRAYELLTELYG